MTLEELVARIVAGEDDLISDLWNQVEKFVSWRAYHFYHSYIDRCQSLLIDIEDLSQVGYFALMQSIKKYDPARGSKFMTVFGYYLKAQFYTLAKMHYTGWQRNPIHKCAHLDEPLPNTDGVSMADMIASETDEIEEAEHEVYLTAIQPVLSKALHGLTTRQFEIVSSIHYDGLTFEETARKYQISRGGVGRAYYRAIHNLQSDVQLRELYAY